MSGRREDGAGKAAALPQVKAKEAANCSEKPGAPQGRAPEKKKTPSMKGGLIEFG